MLALISVIISATLAHSYLSAQSTSIGIARNINRQSQARYIAETGLALAIAYIESTNDWRTAQPNGTWVANEPFGGGTFTIIGVDGEDTNGDGVIDGDGDLTDDPADLATITVTAINDGIAHVARAVIRPIGDSGIVTYEEFTEAKGVSDAQSITLLTPPGTNEGDLLIAAVATDATETLAPPPGGGWTLIDQGNGSNAVTLGVWWKLAEASEPGTHQFSWGSNEQCYAWMMRFTSHNLGDPIHAVVAIGSVNNIFPPSPSVTTTVDYAMIIRLGAFDDDDISVSLDQSGLPGHTTITMDTSGAGGLGACSGGAGYKQQSASGASGATTFTLTAVEQSRAVTIAIAPDPNGDIKDCGGGNTYQVDWRR